VEVLSTRSEGQGAYPVCISNLLVTPSANYLNRHSYIFGAALGFSPEIQQASPFVYRGGNGLVKKDIASEIDYTKADWYAVPVKIGEAVWSDTYFDVGGASESSLMTTYSIGLYNRDSSFIGILTSVLLLAALEWIDSKPH